MGFFSKLFGRTKPPGEVEYHIPRITVEEMSDYPDAISDIFHRRLDGIIVSNLIPEDERQAIIDRIEAWDTDVIEPEMFGKVYGKTLTGSEADLNFYLGQNPSFTASMAELFGQPFEELAGGAMQTMAGGRAVEVPEVAGRGAYKSATIRYLDPAKEGIIAHIGNEFITGLPQCEDIARQVQLKDQLSYFILLQKPDAGGELILYDLIWEKTPKRMIEDKAFRRIWAERQAELEEKYARQVLEMEAGDLLLFDGGRIWHRVTPAEGSQSRITVGGFAAFSRDDKNIYYWS